MIFKNIWKIMFAHQKIFEIYTAILLYLEALKFNFYEFMHFLMAKNEPNQKFRAPKMAKTTFFGSYNFEIFFGGPIWVFKNHDRYNLSTLKELIRRNIFLVRLYFSFFHTVHAPITRCRNLRIILSLVKPKLVILEVQKLLL